MEKRDGQAQRTKRIPTEQTTGCGSSAMQGPVLEISLFQWSVELQRRNGHRVWTTPTNHTSASRPQVQNSVVVHQKTKQYILVFHRLNYI